MKFNADLMNDFLCNDDKLFINIRRGREAQQAVCQTDMAWTSAGSAPNSQCTRLIHGRSLVASAAVNVSVGLVVTVVVVVAVFAAVFVFVSLAGFVSVSVPLAECVRRTSFVL